MALAPPPSYDEVVKHLDAQVGKDFKPSDIAVLKSSLTAEQTQTLLENVPSDPKIDTSKLTEEQRKALLDGMAYAATHPEVDKLMADQIDVAAKNTANIKRIFNDLLLRIGELDAKYVKPGEAKFASRLLAIKQKFDDHISSSAEMANQISTYASRFATILPYAMDKAYTVEDRKAMLEDFTKDAGQIAEKANNVVATFTQLNNDMALFISSFTGWALDKEQAERENVKELSEEITKLAKKIGDLKKAQLAAGVVAAASLPVTGILAACFPPAAPFIIVGGLILAGLSVGTLVGITIALSNYEDDLENKKKRKEQLEQDIDAIQATRKKTQEAGAKDLAEFGAAIGNLSTVWQTCKNDAQSIITYLGKIENDKIPPILQADITQVVQLYSNMSKYLKAYADGVQHVPVLNLAPAQ